MQFDNSNFSFTRFAAYFKMLWVERWRSNIVKVALLFGLCVVLMMWISFLVYPAAVGSEFYGNTRDAAEEPLFVCMSLLFLVGGCVLGSEMLKGARSKGERITMLTMPVTGFEKWLARWMMCVPLYIVAFLGCMYAADTLRVGVFSGLYPQLNVYYLNVFGFSWGSDGVSLLWLIYFYLTAIYVLGGVFFPRKAMLKTTAFTFVLFIVVVLLQISLAVAFSISVSSEVLPVMKIFFWLSVPVLWGLSYWRMKELEVID